MEGTSYPACLESPMCLFLLSEKWTHKAIGYFIIHVSTFFYLLYQGKKTTSTKGTEPYVK